MIHESQELIRNIAMIAKQVIDYIAATASLATVIGIINPIVGVLSATWLVMRMVEMLYGEGTVKRWWKKKRKR